ncbi:FMN-dependent dehydrogenase, includes L-lactate dehydrogenase and type II isopentenyl diphosphate isomerase [Gracilibacillus orientalis]|uniref:L-lactate oxidase n=1 Tax=Gracilibacillus orientalis TaxID=334253 RepID=A0A1I4K2C0_9BACI|nr:alpha-hydroxy-acid oxidizing protein [Gracilibacillus orientalis]SFL72884.1 FMN-dependent dehydrogenase, includes L-lactate dehydrogenase and type II isopentenyl diphosphate isomerase [Gracilibacillus orientalis]
MTASFPIRFQDLEQQAQDRLEPKVFGYIQSGGGREETLRTNETSFEKWQLVPRFGADVSTVSLDKKIHGETIQSPILLAPVGMQALANVNGEKASVSAAHKFGMPFMASTVSSYSLEDIAEACPDAERWFQLYYPNDEALAKSFVQRAEKAGYKAIVVTIDMATLGHREKDLTNKYSPFRLGKGMSNYTNDPIFQSYLRGYSQEDVLAEMQKVFFKPDLNWQHIQQLRKATSLPIYIKGVLHPDDTEKAVELGIDGIVVSNHGGRQLDRCIASIDALPLIKARVQDQLTILLDSGIRSGPDIVTALALGADAVLLGRPFVYGLAISGQSGVENVLENITNDLTKTLQLMGINDVNQVDHTFIRRMSTPEGT